VAYEIMQSYFPDASARFRSLDDIYYYGGQNAHNTIAVLPHEPKKGGEMSVLAGDLIGVAGNHVKVAIYEPIRSLCIPVLKSKTK
jgi:glycoprotein 6-alpha-L-fucosyltransferase